MKRWILRAGEWAVTVSAMVAVLVAGALGILLWAAAAVVATLCAIALDVLPWAAKLAVAALIFWWVAGAFGWR
ncbi:MAG: hypothetical protein OXH59_10020 [Rhodospirillaceae bacterium]|nr:hypothetical protein [Rhodospirillaceae bacterium]